MILDKKFPPDPRVENEAIELIKQGHEVILFCLTYGNELSEEIVNGIKVVRYKSNKLEFKLSALAYTFPFYSYLMRLKITSFLKRFKLNAIHVHDMVVAEAVIKANKKKLPIVLDLHENRPQIMNFYPHLKKFPSNILISTKKWKLKEEELIGKVDKLIVVTEEAKNEVLDRAKINTDNIITAPNTVRKSFYSNSEFKNQNKKHFSLLYIGDTGERRGLNTIVKCLPELRRNINNLKLIIVGKINIDLKKEVERLQVSDLVDFVGWQDESTFQEFIVKSDVCLSPLHRNIHHDTTYANKLFQYMSLGKPLLVSNATAQKNLIERVNSGLVHKEQNVEDFTDKILQLYKNEPLRKKLGENGKKFVREEFTWDKTSKGLIELYNNL